MSTRAAIGYPTGEGFRIIYSHYDGYPSHVGKLLVEHHASKEAMQAIVHGPQIRNFDNDGTVVRFGDCDPDSSEHYESIAEVLDSVFDYCYLFIEGKWKCFGRHSTPMFGIKEFELV